MTAATLPKYPMPVKTAASDTPASESRIDKDSHFNGLYETKQNLRIEGVAEGELQCDGTLTVAEGARVKAKVTASTITIAGELEGEVTCRGIFQIMPTGQVEATVSARRLIVQEGGFYNGEFRMISDEPAPSAAKGGAPHADKDAQAGKKGAAAAPTESNIGSEEWWAKMTGGEPPKDEPKNKPGS